LATVEEIAQTPGIGPEVAAAVHDQLHAVGEGERRATA
jgi:hypothetical protein